MGFLLWEEVSGGVELSFSGFCKIAACVNLGVTLKGLMGVENAAVAVEESCVLDVKSGTVLIISWRQSLDHQTRSNSVCSHQNKNPAPKPWEFP